MQEINKYLLVLILCLIQFVGFSQFNDIESWTDIGLKRKISNKLSVDFEESIRLNQNSGSIKSFNTDLGVDYKLSKIIELSTTYRLSMRKKPNGYFLKHRANIDIKLSQSFNQFKITFRNRTQVEKDNYINEQTDLYAKSENRNRLKVSYNIRGVKTDPFFAIELFHQLNRWNFYKTTETRYQLGVGRKLPNNIKLNLGVIYKRAEQQTIENTLIFNVALKKSF